MWTVSSPIAGASPADTPVVSCSALIAVTIVLTFVPDVNEKS